MGEDRGMLTVHKVAVGAAVAWGVAITAVVATILLDGERFDPAVDVAVAIAAVWTIIAGQCMSRRRMAEAVARRIALQAEADRLTRI